MVKYMRDVPQNKGRGPQPKETWRCCGEGLQHQHRSSPSVGFGRLGTLNASNVCVGFRQMEFNIYMVSSTRTFQFPPHQYVSKTAGIQLFWKHRDGKKKKMQVPC